MTSSASPTPIRYQNLDDFSVVDERGAVVLRCRQAFTGSGKKRYSHLEISASEPGPGEVWQRVATFRDWTWSLYRGPRTRGLRKFFCDVGVWWMSIRAAWCWARVKRLVLAAENA